MVCSQAAERIVGARFATCHRSDGADPNADGTLTVHAVENQPSGIRLTLLIDCLWMTGKPEVILKLALTGASPAPWFLDDFRFADHEGVG